MKLLIVAVLLSLSAENAPAQNLKSMIPMNQQSILKVFRPSIEDESKPGDGKFVIFSRESVGKENEWDFIAGAWECIPSHPEIPVTRRIEFCHSSWNAEPLLNVLIRDGSTGMYPRFVTLQVDSTDPNYTVNLYDINYRTWDVKRIWHGGRLDAFGVLGNSIFCNHQGDWFLLNAGSGGISRNTPFTPNDVDGAFWLVRKPGESSGCWSYDSSTRQYIAHFNAVDVPSVGYSSAKLSPDGKTRAWVLAPMPTNWSGGVISGKLILQRSEQKDISLPIEMQAFAGSGVPVIPWNAQLTYSSDGKLQFRAQKGFASADDQVWTIDIATGKDISGVAPHLDADTGSTLDGCLSQIICGRKSRDMRRLVGAASPRPS